MFFLMLSFLIISFVICIDKESVMLGFRNISEGQCKSELNPCAISFSSKVCYQNLNPIALNFEPKSKHFVFNNSTQPYSYSTLNPSAQTFVPLSSSNSNDLYFDFDITPEVFHSTTPNNSFGDISDTMPIQGNSHLEAT